MNDPTCKRYLVMELMWFIIHYIAGIIHCTTTHHKRVLQTLVFHKSYWLKLNHAAELIYSFPPTARCRRACAMTSSM